MNTFDLLYALVCISDVVLKSCICIIICCDPTCDQCRFCQLHCFLVLGGEVGTREAYFERRSVIDSQLEQGVFGLLDDRVSKNVKALSSIHAHCLLLSKSMIGSHNALRPPSMQADQAER
jgi:hypothetical protein